MLTKRNTRSMSGDAIEEYRATQEWQIAGIKAGLASLDTRCSISHERVVDWVSSWDDEEERPKPKP